MNSTATAVLAAGRALPEPLPDRAAVQAWQAFLLALDELTARHAAARQRPYARQSPAALAALAADLAGSSLMPDEVAGCAFAWPPPTRWRPMDVRALAAECARPTAVLP